MGAEQTLRPDPHSCAGFPMSQIEPRALLPVTDDLASAFREAFRCHPAGVAVLAADTGEGPVALTISSLISVSAAPPVVAFSLSANSSATARLLAAQTVVIHLARSTDLEIARLGSTRGADRFGAGIAWERLPSGEPRYSGMQTWFRAQVRGTLAVDGATLVAAELLEGAVSTASASPEEDALVYFDRRWHRLRPLEE